MDVLALPILGALVVGFLIYVWVAWLSKKEDRALTIDEDDNDEKPSVPHY
jgi:hypothetical protein